jgi:biotin carboxyl carrier protein
MKRIFGLLTVGLVSLGAIAQVPQLMVASPTPGSDMVEPVEETGQRLQLTLTLSTPADLKVREGDQVEQGQILSDRVRDRQRLEAQKRQIQIQMERLSQPIAGAATSRPIPEVAGLPPASFLEEVADMERSRLKVEAAARHLESQQRKLDLLQALPSAEVPEAVLPHEQAVLAQRQRELDQAQGDLQFSQAQLAKAQADRQYQEYLHSLEMSKRAIALQQAEIERQGQLQKQEEQERQRSFQLAQLAAQLQALDSQIMTLSAVRSPFSGTIQRIKYQGQNDQSLVVQLILTADASASRSESGSR